MSDSIKINYIKSNAYKIAFAACFLIAVGYLLMSADPPGYCSSQARFLSDEEFIAIALRDEIKRGNLKLEESAVAIHAFQTVHPDCCQVDRVPGSLIERRFGINTVGVHLYYKANVVSSDSNASGDIYNSARATINACGRIERMRSGHIEKQYFSINY